MLSRHEILEEIDPMWHQRFLGDFELAWGFYWEHSRQQIDNIRYADNNYDGAPYCSAGHRTKASCDCGDIASND